MGFRFRRGFKIAPGVRLNMGRHGFTSVSLGGRGLTTNVGPRGVRTTIGLPGTGLSYTTRTPAASKRTVVTRLRVPITTGTAVAAPKHNSHKVLKTVGTLLLALVVAAAAHPLVGLIVGLVLLWLILRKPKPLPVDAGVGDFSLEPRESPAPILNAAPSQMLLERLRLTAATKLSSDHDGRSRRVGQLPPGCDVTVLSRHPGWMFVQDDTGVQGWARDQNWTALLPG